MNSSGIKRGLAASAIAALAVAGLPLLAGSANAAVGDVIQVAKVGPIRNGGAQGGIVVLKTKNVDPTKLILTKPDFSGAANASDFSIVSATLVPDAANNPNGGLDGFDEINVRLAATTVNPGDNFSVGVVEDESSDGVNNSDARAVLSGTTSGAPAAVSVSPATQTAANGVPSGDYTVSVKDAGGRLTQLNTGEAFTLSAQPGGVAFSSSSANFVAGPPSKLSGGFDDGTSTFKATGTGTGLRTLTIAGDGVANSIPASVNTTAQLDVVKAADLSLQKVDVVTGADTWDGAQPTGTSKDVRTDQKSIVVNVIGGASNANTTAVFNITSATAKFGGQGSTTATVNLDGNGNGSFTITPDASSIADGAAIQFQGAGYTGTVTYRNPVVSKISPASSNQYAKFGSTNTVSASVVDQFGLPVQGVFLTAQITNGPNSSGSVESARTPVDSNGSASFTFTDTKATALNNVDTITYKAYASANPSIAPTPLTIVGEPFTSTITYNTDGLGPDFTVTLDGTNTTGSAYNPANLTEVPLTDGVADDKFDGQNAGPAVVQNENVTVGAVGATTGTLTVSADNGAVVVKNPTAATTLADGKASQSGLTTDTFSVIGTKAGLVTVTVVNNGRTHTAQYTVKQPGGAATDSSARNVSVMAPAKAKSGGIAVFTAKITDAFGNPVAGVYVNNLNVQVSGPGRLQDSSAQSDANGVINLNVRVDQNTSSPVTVRVDAFTAGNQFGAVADDEYSFDALTKSAPGLSASVTTATATVSDVANIEALQAAVKAAQDKVDAAGQLVAADAATVAADKVVLKKAYKALKKAKANHKGVKRAKKAVKRAKAQLAFDKAALAAAKAQLVAAQAELAAAQAALDAANS